MRGEMEVFVLKRLRLTLLVMAVAALGAWGTAAMAKPAAVYGVDACVVGGSTTVSWDNFHAGRVDFFWFDGNTPLGVTTVEHVKSPLTVPTLAGANRVSVEWWSGGPGGPSARYGVLFFTCSWS